MNVHGGILAYRGASLFRQQFWMGQTGISIMLMDEGLGHRLILRIGTTPILPGHATILDTSARADLELPRCWWKPLSKWASRERLRRRRSPAAR